MNMQKVSRYIFLCFSCRVRQLKGKEKWILADCLE